MSRAIIKVENVFSWLKTNDENVSLTLWRALRFRAKNYFHSRLYKQKIWDGFNEFYLKDSGRFLTGLLPEVEAALTHLGCEYKMTDERSGVTLIHNSIDNSFLSDFKKNGKPILLEDYQVDLTNQALKYLRGVIFAPTASGKSLVMSAIVKCINPNTPALILSNRKSVVQQNYEEMVEMGVKNIGILHSDQKEPNIITCACVQSLHKLEKLLPKIKVLIVDEIHEMTSKVPVSFYKKLKGCGMRIAVSATPFKHGGKDKSHKYLVKGHFGPVLKIQSDSAEKGILVTKKLQGKGRLSEANCIFYPITEPELPYAIYMDAVDRGIANNLYFNQIIKRLAYKQQGRTLILVERLQHGDLLKSLIPDSLWVQGKDDLATRKEVITKLKKSKENVIAIATQGIFNTGVDFRVHQLINAAGGKAEHVIIQRFGRGLRAADDKVVLNYYDFIFTINEYLERHSKDRIKILQKEGHIVEIKDTIDF